MRNVFVFRYSHPKPLALQRNRWATFKKQARCADIYEHRQLVLRAMDLAIEHRLAHREPAGTLNPCRRLGRKCSRWHRGGDSLSSSHRLPVIHILITATDTNL